MYKSPLSLSTRLLAANGQVKIVIYLKVSNVYNSFVCIDHLTFIGSLFH